MNNIGPHWTERVTNTDVGGEDHLGVEGVAQSYQQHLVPGIISTTDHARYYSFYCWILYRYINQPDSPRTLSGFGKQYFKRHELAFITACYSHHRERGFLTGLVGSGLNNRKARHIWENSNPIPLDEHQDYFGDPLGGFGQYYRPAMQVMGLVAPAESPRWVYRLTKRGEAMAEAFAANIVGTGYAHQLEQEGEVATLAHEAATEYGRRACLCPEAMTDSADRPLLLDAFFRLDQSGLDNPHVRRRLTLALILDLAQQSDAVPLRQTLRRGLYLGWYEPGNPYRPEAALADSYQRWRMVQVRHTYTGALQILWAVFLDHLRDSDNQQVGFEAFIDWVSTWLSDGSATMTTGDYLTRLCSAVGLEKPWQESATSFHEACQSETAVDELTLFDTVLATNRDPAILIPNALRILAQLFLRHHTWFARNDPIWQEVAQQERLPLDQFMQDLDRAVEANKSVNEWLTWLYRHYCLSQHEVVALQKLRYNKYNTFKAYYQDGLFTWANNPPTFQVPLRYPSLRLFNGLTILSDLGLVEEDADGICSLTTDGQAYLSRVCEANNGN
jgi:hypothetical protein